VSKQTENKDIHPELGNLEATYFCASARKSFDVVQLHEKGEHKGEPVIKMHPLNNTPLYCAGEPEYVTKTYQFSTQTTRVSKGTLCTFKVYEKHPKALKDRLLELSKDPSSDVNTWDNYMKVKDKKVYEQMQMTKAAKQRTVVVEKENAGLKKQVADLQAKLKKAGG
jgi:hypothetical protein